MLLVHPHIKLLQVADAGAEMRHFIDRNRLAEDSSASQNGHQDQQQCGNGSLPSSRGLMIRNHRCTPQCFIRLPRERQYQENGTANEDLSLGDWSGIRESNPRLDLGKVAYYHYTNPAWKVFYSMRGRTATRVVPRRKFG